MQVTLSIKPEQKAFVSLKFRNVHEK